MSVFFICKEELKGKIAIHLICKGKYKVQTALFRMRNRIFNTKEGFTGQSNYLATVKWVDSGL